MSTNTDIIRDFIAAWSRLDAAELADYFTEDGTYHNMPMGPVSGKSNVQGFIAAFLKNWTQTNWDVLNLSEHENIVFAERLDRTKLGDISVDLPCCGVFEMHEGKIRVWRDYFDMATYTKALE